MTNLEVFIVVLVSLIFGLIAGVSFEGEAFLAITLISMIVISFIWWSYSKGDDAPK